MKRQDIVTSLASLLGTISIGAGFSTNCGANVFVWRRTTLKDEEVPCICVWDTVAERNDDYAPIGFQGWDLHVGVIAYFEPSTPASVARLALDDVVKAIGTNPNLSGLADRHIEVMSHEIALDNKTNTVGMARIQLVIPYVVSLHKL